MKEVKDYKISPWQHAITNANAKLEKVEALISDN